MAPAKRPWEVTVVMFSAVVLSLLLSAAGAPAFVQTDRARSRRLMFSHELSTDPGSINLEQGSGSGYFHSRHLQTQGTKPPEGSYTLIVSEESFVEVFTSSMPTKRLRLRPGLVVRPCAALAVAPGTSVVVDCRGATLDLRCATSFTVDVDASAQLFDCHVLWSPVSDFFNIVSETDTLRIEEGGVLEQRDGSSTVNCAVRPSSRHTYCTPSLSPRQAPASAHTATHVQAMKVPDEQALFGSEQPTAGEVLRVDAWASSMGTTSGQISLEHADLYCIDGNPVQDTSSAEFAAALDAAVDDPDAVLSISGAPRLPIVL